jgi:UDP-3-O-[3-hydroxymyristoyl] N-acetylglucosamine deacetylase
VIYQRTIKRRVQIEGIGLHSGCRVTLTLSPAEANTGIRYRRVDYQPPVELIGDPRLVHITPLCTCIEDAQGVKISTVEHLNAALSGLGVDNILIELDAAELPILDGSAFPFIELLLQAGIEVLNTPKQFLWVTEPVSITEDDKWAELLPHQGFCVDLTIDFNHPAVEAHSQQYCFNFSVDSFVQQISRARTFGFMQEVTQLQARGLCLGGSLDCAVVLDEQRVLNPEGLRFPDELVRHKILDVVGDLFVGGYQLLGAFKAFKSGHALNNRLLRSLLARRQAWQLAPFADDTLFSMSETSLNFVGAL